MKINNPKRSISHKKLLIVSGAILLLIVAAMIYVYAFKGTLFGWKTPQSTQTNNSNNGVDYKPATTEQQQAGTTVKTGSSDTTTTPAPIPNSTKKNVQVSITAANQNGSTLQIRVLIGAVENTGTCTLTLTRAGENSVTKTSNTQALSSTSTCQGFDVSTSELSPGTWQALITYDSSTLTGSTTKNITIQ